MAIARSFTEFEHLTTADFLARNVHCDIFPYTHPYTKPLEIAVYATRSDTF